MESKDTDRKPYTYIGVPTHSGLVDVGTVYALLKAARTSHVATELHTAPLLANNFNQLLCNAINLRKGGLPLTHFCLMHSDIVPVQSDWLNILQQEMAANDLRVISAVVPIKDARGLTSTGMCVSIGEHAIKGDVRRITITESMKMPTTFTGDDAHKILQGTPRTNLLLINTGLMLIDLDLPFVDELYFTVRDEIRMEAMDGGDGMLLRKPYCEPEDWFFSRLLNRKGVRYGATRAVDVEHIGRFRYDSRVTWGHEMDPAHFPVPSEEAIEDAANADAVPV